MAGPGRWQVQVDGRSRYVANTCASEVHPVFNPVSPYGYLLPNMYSFTTDIANPDYFCCCCRTFFLKNLFY